MEYTIGELARMAGVSTRTLRHFETKGLLSPLKRGENGYREYGREQVERLQQVLLYRELGMPLDTIRATLDSPGFDREQALEAHLTELKAKRKQLDALVKNVTKTLEESRGESTMTDSEKFQGLRKQMVRENEKKYGDEARNRYGNEMFDASQERLGTMSQQQWEHQERLEQQIAECLKTSLDAGGDPAGEQAQKACELHAEWIRMFWPEGTYNKKAQLGLAQMYVADERFKAYYDAIGDGAAELLSNALTVYCLEDDSQTS